MVIVMDIIIDIQGFRDAFDKFIPKEVAVVAINASFVGHWIMISPYPFGELPEKTRRENNWLSRNYHGLEWFDGEADPKYFTRQLQEIVRTVRCIYVRGSEKARYLRNLLCRNVYNLEEVSPPFKNLSDVSEGGRRCAYHGFRTGMKFVCALQNAYKLKRWLVAQNTSGSSDGTSFVSHSSDSWAISDNESEKSDDYIFMKNIETWRRSSAIGEEEEKNLAPREAEVKAYHVNEPVIKAYVKEQHLSSKDRDCFTETSSVSDNSAKKLPIFENTRASSTKKETIPEVVQIIPLTRTPPNHVENEFIGNLTSVASSQCEICGSLSCRPTAEDVDETDRHHR